MKRVYGSRRAVAEHAGDVDPQGRLIDGAQGEAVPGVGVERAEAGAAQRIERVDGDVAGAAQGGLVAGVGEAELVGAGEHVARRLGVGVEAEDLELVGRPGAEAEVGAVIVGLAVAVPEPEVAELREAARARWPGSIGLARKRNGMSR